MDSAAAILRARASNLDIFPKGACSLAQGKVFSSLDVHDQTGVHCSAASRNVNVHFFLPTKDPRSMTAASCVLSACGERMWSPEDPRLQLAFALGLSFDSMFHCIDLLTLQERSVPKLIACGCRYQLLCTSNPSQRVPPVRAQAALPKPSTQGNSPRPNGGHVHFIIIS